MSSTNLELGEGMIDEVDGTAHSVVVRMEAGGHAHEPFHKDRPVCDCERPVLSSREGHQLPIRRVVRAVLGSGWGAVEPGGT